MSEMISNLFEYFTANAVYFRGLPQIYEQMAKQRTVSPDKIVFDEDFLKHKANGETEHVFTTVED